MASRQNIAVYLDALNLFSGLRLLRLTVFRRVVSVRYLVADRCGRAFEGLLKRTRLCSDVGQISPDSSAGALRGGSDYDWTNLLVRESGEGIVSRLYEGRSTGDFLPAGVAEHRRRAWLRKSVQREIFTPVHLALVGEQRGGADTETLVLADLADLAPVLEQELRKTVNARMLGYARPRNMLTAMLSWFLFVQASKVIRGLADLLRVARSGDARESPSVAVEYTRGTRGFTPLENQLWWHPESGLPADRCVVLFNHSRYKATDQILADLDSRDLRHTILKHEANASSRATDGFPTQPLGRTASDLMRCLRLLLSAPKVVARRWQVSLWLATITHMRRWQRLMEVENIRVILTVEETAADPVSLAADLAEAIRLGYCWSSLYPLMGRIVRLHQVYFAWGPRDQSLIVEGGLDGLDAVVQGGSVFDVGDPDQGHAGVDSGSPSGLPGTSYTVCAFDRSIGYYGPARHVEFYEALISWAEADPALGLILKHKGDAPRVFHFAPDLERRVSALVREGRALLFGARRTVREAVRRSDAVVAMGWNSAGIVAALDGARVVYWDGADLLGGPAADLVRQFNWHDPLLAFTDLTRLTEALGRYLQSPTDTPGFGDMSSLLDRFDPFRDGQATLRIGLFVRWFIDEMDKDAPRDEALSRVLARYGDRWGEDKVAVRPDS